MGKLRLLFVKEGRAVYLSHLDLLRTFQRVFMRQGLVLRHSQGFHPHPILSFALPLPVGQSSECELLDFETVEELDAAHLPTMLNRFMPAGIRAVRCYVPQRPIRELAALRCRVELFYDHGVPDGAGQEMTKLLGQKHIVIQKRTKRKDITDVDIRPLVLQFDGFESGTGVLCTELVVAAQNPGLNPALLADAAKKYLPDCAPDFARVRRLAALDASGTAFW